MPLSLLDRLIEPETEPHVHLDVRSLEYSRRLRDSVCRDLAALLNTRRAEQDFDPAFEETANSLLTFGISDFTSMNLTNGIEQETVRCSIERAIRKFEPRLSQVSVVLEEPDTANPILRLQIEALLRVGSWREPVSFDATLHRDSRRIAVSGAVR